MSDNDDIVREHHSGCYGCETALDAMEERERGLVAERDEARERIQTNFEHFNYIASVAEENAAALLADVRRLRDAIVEANASLATGPLKHGYAYSVLEAALGSHPTKGARDGASI